MKFYFYYRRYEIFRKKNGDLKLFAWFNKENFPPQSEVQSEMKAKVKVNFHVCNLCSCSYSRVLL